MSDVKTIDLLTFGGEDVKCVRLSDYEALRQQLAAPMNWRASDEVV